MKRLRFVFETLRFLVLSVESLFPGFYIVIFLIERFLTLVHPALQPRNLAAAVAYLFVQIGLEADDFFLCGENGFLLFILGFACGFVQKVLRELLRAADFLFHHVFPIQIPAKSSCGQRNQCDDNRNDWTHEPDLSPFCFSSWMRLRRLF